MNAGDSSLPRREAVTSTSTHVAICASRALRYLTDADKVHLRNGGGLLAVLDTCKPTLYSVSGPSRKATDTFILVDKRLALNVRYALGFATTNINSSLNASTTEQA